MDAAVLVSLRDELRALRAALTRLDDPGVVTLGRTRGYATVDLSGEQLASLRESAARVATILDRLDLGDDQP